MDIAEAGKGLLSKAKLVFLILLVGILVGAAMYHAIAYPALKEPLEGQVRELQEKNSLLEKEIMECLEIRGKASEK